MRIHELRPDRGRGGYARPRSVGALTTVWVGRSVSAACVFKPAVVTQMSLEGKR
jgi:hypothetical protein